MLNAIRDLLAKQFRYANACVWGYELERALKKHKYCPRTILDLCGGDGMFLDLNYPRGDQFDRTTVDIKAEPQGIGHRYLQHDMYSHDSLAIDLKPDLICFLNTYNLLESLDGLIRQLGLMSPLYVFVAVPTDTTLSLVRERNPDMNFKHAPVEEFFKDCGYTEIERSQSMQHHYLLQPVRLLLTAIALRFQGARDSQVTAHGYYETLLFRRDTQI